MNVSEMEDIQTHDVAVEPVMRSLEEAKRPEECEQCGAPVDRLQRYCVNCGAHRHHVPDPAARYLAQASARARLGGARTGRPTARRRSALSPVTAALLAAVLAGGGVAVGTAIDGGSANNDAQLVRALHHLGVGRLAAGSNTTNSSSNRGGGSNTATGGSGGGGSDSGGESGSSGSAAKRLQHATGKNYVKQAQQLPNSVAIP